MNVFPNGFDAARLPVKSDTLKMPGQFFNDHGPGDFKTEFQ